MISRRVRRHVTYANILSTICLMVIVGTSTAWAAQHLRGADIVDNSLTGKDIKNGSLTATDLAPATRTTYTDTSPWEKIPSGTTVSGGFYQAYQSRNPNDVHIYGMQLPALPSTAFDAANVNFAADAFTSTPEDDAACTGTASTPTAPAGHICLYLETSTGVASLVASGWANSEDRAQGLFYIQWSDTGVPGTLATIQGRWAYTAP